LVDPNFVPPCQNIKKTLYASKKSPNLCFIESCF
jgi:hypothetical protein